MVLPHEETRPKPTFTRFDAYYRTSDLEHVRQLAADENRSAASVLRDLLARGRSCLSSHAGCLHLRDEECVNSENYNGEVPRAASTAGGRGLTPSPRRVRHGRA